MTSQINKVRALLSQAKAQEDTLKIMNEQEEKDALDFANLRPQMEAIVNSAEDVVEVVRIISQPLLDDLPEPTHAADSMGEIERAAAEGQRKIGDARVQLNANLQTVNKYAPQTREDAFAIFA